MIGASERNPVLDHVWGASPGADRVWAQIAPIAPSTKPWERRFVVLQAFIDDSYTEGGTLVLAGYVATAEKWASFSAEWERLLPNASRGPSGRHRFKMSEMARYMERVPAFYKVIEDHAILALHCKVDIQDLERAIGRIWSPNLQLIFGPAINPFWTCFCHLLTIFHRGRYEQQWLVDLLPLDKKVDFYFDEHSSQDEVPAFWDSFTDNEPEPIADLYGAMPRFENDEEFLPLQAADFLAWWMRKGYENGQLEKYMGGDFGEWRGTKLVPTIYSMVSEDAMVEDIITRYKMASGLGIMAEIYDEKTHPRNHSLPIVDVRHRSAWLSKIKSLLRRS